MRGKGTTYVQTSILLSVQWSSALHNHAVKAGDKGYNTGSLIRVCGRKALAGHSPNTFVHPWIRLPSLTQGKPHHLGLGVAIVTRGAVSQVPSPGPITGNHTVKCFTPRLEL
jgi:hypothetical protein